MASVQISVPEEFDGLVKQVMKVKGYEAKGDAVLYIGQVFTSRWKAVRKYADKQGGSRKPRAKKKVAKKAAKKAAARKPAAKRTKAPAPAAQGSTEATAAV